MDNNPITTGATLPARSLMPSGNLRLASKGVTVVQRTPKPQAITAAAPVQPRHRFMLRLLITVGMSALFLFVYWLLGRQHAGYKPLYYLLLVSVGYKVLKVLFEWYHYWAIQNPATPPLVTRRWTVDMFTTAMPGEPYELIKETLTAMVAVRYPHNTYLCDEGDDAALKALCASLGVHHVTRKIKVNAKAGNINNALRSATGDICVILDPDHKPVPQMLDEVLPYFEDENIGFVQSVQGYKNSGESPVALGAAEQTYTFYGPLMMGMSTYGTAQAIGANCVFRRAALDSIGGHAAGLSEDMHTAMRLHAEGWKSVYVPKMLTRGLVPANIGAYYKQQLKWSRGTFELLFMVLPFLFGKLTWRQRVHYSFIPLHFAAGIIALIDLIIPLAALLTGEAPLLLEFSRAYLYLLPFFVMILLVRQYAQRWLLEKKEQGFHLTGGILLFGTWWVFLIGFIYTLLRVKVPYIPTPKDNEYQNHFGLSIPNLAVCVASVGIIAYGVHLDSNPYNLLMAGYAAFNALLLLLIVWAGQDALRQQLAKPFRHAGLLKAPVQKMRKLAQRSANAFFAVLRSGAPQLTVLAIFAFVLLAWKAAHKTEPVEIAAHKDLGGFYLGLNLPEARQHPATVQHLEQSLQQQVNVTGLTEYWNNDEHHQLPDGLLADVAAGGGMPLINWLPVSRTPLAADSLSQGKGIWSAIVKGRFDAYITRYAEKMRQYGHPVFINFAPESDNPARPWYVNRFNPVQDYIKAFQHVQILFQEVGVANVSWVWNPWKAGNMRVLYPGYYFVDWVAVSSISPTDSLGRPVSFAASFAPFHRNLKDVAKPVMLTGIKKEGSAAYASWLKNAIRAFNTHFPEVAGMILENGNRSKHLAYFRFAAAGNKAVEVAQGFADALSLLPKAANFETNITVSKQLSGAPLQARQLQGKAGNFRIMVAGSPFYIKGVAYNAEQSWRDGYHPLNRKKLDRDFGAIREMGANTIRRYAPSAYDRDILKAAGRHGLKVMYGFWFDPKVDYARDKEKVAAYIREVTDLVERYKEDSVILAWNIGNESSGLLKHHFAQPYLTVVRKAYMEMIEVMARRVHRMDPERPVLSTLEHARQLPGELYGFDRHAPSVDVLAVNAYYKEWIGRVHGLAHRFRPGKPYMISEFGPKGYWDPKLNDKDRRGQLVEESDKYKALLYATQWQQDIEAHEGCNVGGIAFCWQDRYEGTATWFGLTDYKGRKKQAYDALQQVWAGAAAKPFTDLFINGPDFSLKPGGTYEFTAVSSDKSLTDFEWQLLRDDYLGETGIIAAGSGQNKVNVTLPRDGSRYRLYVYAKKGKDRVITASRPIILYAAVYNEGI